MSRWDYGKGLPSVINGTAESEEQLQQQAREVVARKLGIDPRSMVERRDKGSAEPDLRYTPMVDLKPTKILHKPGEYGHPNFKKTQLPNKEKQQPQYGVKPINGHDRSTFPYNQKEAMATADAMDQAAANTKTRINQIHKNPASKIIEKQQSIKDLQRITDIAYKYSNDHWEHQPKWELDRKTGSPVDVADPKTQNDRTVKQLQELKSWSQGGKVNAPHVKLHAAPKGRDFYYNASTNEMELVKNPSPHRPTLQAANKADPAAGAKYIDWWNRIETKTRT